MTLFVNEKELILFEGAKVGDALQMYDNSAVNEVNNNNAEVLDVYGNKLSLDGALREGSRIFFRKKVE